MNKNKNVKGLLLFKGLFRLYAALIYIGLLIIILVGDMFLPKIGTASIMLLFGISMYSECMRKFLIKILIKIMGVN